MKKVFLRADNGYDTDEVSNATGLACEDPSLAQQSFKDECDINTILERFGVTGELPTARAVPQYGDFSQVVDYQTAMNSVRASQEAFMELPAKIRARFENDPAKLLDFLGDEANRDEAVALGLVPKAQEVVAPAEVPAAEGSLAQ